MTMALATYPQDRFYVEDMNGEYVIFDRENEDLDMDAVFAMVIMWGSDTSKSQSYLRAIITCNALNAWNEIGMIP